MAGYIGAKQGVTQVDGYNRSEADAEFVQTAGDTMTGALAVNGNLTVDTNTLFVDAASNNVGVGTSSPRKKFEVTGAAGVNAIQSQDSANGTNFLRMFSDVTFGAAINADASSPIRFAHSNEDFTGFTERMRIDTAGRVTMPYQPAFNVYKNDGDNQSVVGATVVWNGTAQNIGGHYSTSTGRFTAPVAGTYFFTISVMTGSLGNYGLYQLRKNDGVVVLPSDGQWAQAYVSDTNDAIVSASGTVYLSAGDFVSVFVASSYPNFYWAGYNNFSGYLLG